MGEFKSVNDESPYYSKKVHCKVGLNSLSMGNQIHLHSASMERCFDSLWYIAHLQVNQANKEWIFPMFVRRIRAEEIWHLHDFTDKRFAVFERDSQRLPPA